MTRYLITGASRGIGRSIAEILAAPDRLLLLHGRDEGALAESCRLVEAKNGRAMPLLYDLREPKQIDQIVATIGSEPLEALINNAGMAVVKPLAQISLEEWQASLALNVTAPFLLTQRLASAMQTGSSIVNILSVAAKTGFPDWSCYCMSKFALEGFAQSVREELRPRGIRVVNIYPAATDTEIWDDVAGDWPRNKMMRPQAVADAVSFALSQPADVAVESIQLTSLSGRL